VGAWCATLHTPNTVAEIENAIVRFSVSEAEQVREWLEDQREITPESLASIEGGRTDLAAGRTRIARP
jgi:hypothetical protein